MTLPLNSTFSLITPVLTLIIFLVPIIAVEVRIFFTFYLNPRDDLVSSASSGNVADHFESVSFIEIYRKF